MNSELLMYRLMKVAVVLLLGTIIYLRLEPIEKPKLQDSKLQIYSMTEKEIEDIYGAGVEWGRADCQGKYKGY